MGKISRYLILILNLITTLLSVAAIGWSFGTNILRQETQTHCHHTLATFLLFAGLALFAVSLLGLCGTLFRVRYLLYLYMFVLIVFIVGWFVLSVFAFIVSHKGAGKVVSQVSIARHHQLSNWLENHVVGGKTWVQIRSCLRVSTVCRNHDFIDPIQSGCCKPPKECGLGIMNEDCGRWSSDPMKLCYDCDSCKDSVLYDIRNSWRQVVVVNALITCFLIIVFSFACFSRRAIDESIHRQPTGHA